MELWLCQTTSRNRPAGVGNLLKGGLRFYIVVDSLSERIVFTTIVPTFIGSVTLLWDVRIDIRINNSFQDQGGIARPCEEVVWIVRARTGNHDTRLKIRVSRHQGATVDEFAFAPDALLP